MKFKFTEEQHDLRSAVRKFLTAKSPSAEVRRLMETDAGYEPTVWKQMAQQLGLQGLAIPEEYGGSGFGWVELLIVFEEMGAALLCAPFLSSTIAAVTVLATDDNPARASILPRIADGEALATLAYTEDADRHEDEHIQMVATGADSNWTLTGRKTLVLDGGIADILLVAARTPAGLSLFSVDGDAPGLSRTTLAGMDATRRLAQIDLDATPGRLLGREGTAAPVLATARSLAAVALAAEQVGGAQHCLSMSVEYAKVRHQFGRAIGSFQAIKHQCADMLMEVETARSLAYNAAWVAAENAAELALWSSVAQAYCSDAYFAAASANIQIHGGIGYTWEHDAHLYFKRAKSSEVLFGGPTHHRRLVADHIGI
jgi:alkylation response protein AidB-like acyl-CoA dehydrogenase